jgi:hypothetical protein
MTPAADYTQLDRQQINKWDATLQQAVEGWQVRARWNATGTVLTVFVPLTQYNPANVDTLIRQAGAVEDEVAALGTRG